MSDLPLAERVRPVLDQVLVRPMDNFADASGLILPEAYDDDAHGSDRDFIREGNQLCLGVVIAVGEGWKYPKTGRAPLDVEVGEKVMYNRADAKLVQGTAPALVLVRHHAIFLRVEGSVRQVVGGLVSQ